MHVRVISLIFSKIGRIFEGYQNYEKKEFHSVFFSKNFQISRIVTIFCARWKKQLVTSIIYPQKNRVPIYNPSGKYMVKLHFNGCRRKVIVDDLLPYSWQLMCATSTNRNELWVSIVEKAFLKVMGGYDFPGSNSSADLYVLTGWVPERYNLKDSSLSSYKSPEDFFDMILKYFKAGNCLINFGTGDYLSENKSS